MKKAPLHPIEDQYPVAALMTLISEGVKKAEKLKDPLALRDWLELGCSVLEKFGGDNPLESPEFLKAMEKTSSAELSARDGDLTSPVYEENFTPEAAASILNSCIRFCDVIISGNDCAIGLKYNEENMFAPMIVLLESNASAAALIWAAENLDVPVIKNPNLAKNLISYGKTGESIPDSTCREVSLAFARLSPARPQWRSRSMRKNRQSIPIQIPLPLSLELGEALYALSGEEPGREKLLVEPLNAIRKKLKYLLGFSIPAFRIFCGKNLKSDEYRILFKGFEAGRGRLELGWYASSRKIGDALVIPDLMNNPKNISAAAKAAVKVIIRHIDNVVQLRAAELLGRDEVEAILDAAEEKYPVVTGEVKSLLSLGMIREIFQTLVSEQVSIRHIAIILESLADWGAFGPAPGEIIIEQIRQSLKRQICLDYADRKLNLRVLTLESKLENKFESSGYGADPAEEKAGNHWAEDWTDKIFPSVRRMEEKGFPPVILCSPKVRFSVKEATRRKLPNLAVLSYLEIPPDINVVPLGEIRLEGNVRFSGLPAEK